MNSRLAVIDLGTNTFHLLIVDLNGDDAFTVVLRTREFVKLAEKGMRVLTKEKFNLGLDVLRRFRALIDEHGATSIRANATEGLRRAENSDAFIQEVRAQALIDIRVISGDEEAAYIYEGIKHAVPIGEKPVLMMDIGGGSVEFIIANQHRILWKQSFPIGAAILRAGYHKSEPISGQELNDLLAYIDQELEPLKEKMKEHEVDRLIGASGSFETLANIESNGAFLSGKLGNLKSFDINLGFYRRMHEQIVRSDESERKRINGMVSERVDMMVVGSVLINYIVNRFNINEMVFSNYALKEGIIFEMNKKLAD